MMMMMMMKNKTLMMRRTRRRRMCSDATLRWRRKRKKDGERKRKKDRLRRHSSAKRMIYLDFTNRLILRGIDLIGLKIERRSREGKGGEKEGQQRAARTCDQVDRKRRKWLNGKCREGRVHSTTTNRNQREGQRKHVERRKQRDCKFKRKYPTTAITWERLTFKSKGEITHERWR